MHYLPTIRCRPIKIFVFLCHNVTQGIDFRQSPFQLLLQYTSLSSTVKFKENGSTLRKLVLTVPKEHPVYTLDTCIAWVLIDFIDILSGWDETNFLGQDRDREIRLMKIHYETETEKKWMLIF